MNLQIIPFGLVIFGLYAGLILLLVIWPLSRLLKGRSWRRPLLGIVAAVLLASPFAEEFWIAWHFRELCKDAGVHVYRKVEVDGFYDSTMRSGYELIQQKGYRFMEHPAREAGKIEHIERIAGEWKVSLLYRPTARYHYKYAYQPTPYKYEEPVGWKIERTEWQVIDSENGEILGRETKYSRYPATVEAVWMARLFGSGRSTCKGLAPTPPETRHSIFEYVLIPKRMK